MRGSPQGPPAPTHNLRRTLMRVGLEALLSHPQPQGSARATARTWARARWPRTAPGSAAAPPTSRDQGVRWTSAAAVSTELAWSTSRVGMSPASECPASTLPCPRLVLPACSSGSAPSSAPQPPLPTLPCPCSAHSACHSFLQLLGWPGGPQLSDLRRPLQQRWFLHHEQQNDA